MSTEKINDGGPAFPGSYTGQNGMPVWREGMTLRDYFAAKAMQGLMAARDRPSGRTIVEYSYQMADNLLKERE